MCCFSMSLLAFVQPTSHEAVSLCSALNYSSFFQDSLPQPASKMGKAVILSGAARTGLACPHHCKYWSCVIPSGTQVAQCNLLCGWG